MECNGPHNFTEGKYASVIENSKQFKSLVFRSDAYVLSGMLITRCLRRYEKNYLESKLLPVFFVWHSKHCIIFMLDIGFLIKTSHCKWDSQQVLICLNMYFVFFRSLSSPIKTGQSSECNFAQPRPSWMHSVADTMR